MTNFHQRGKRDVFAGGQGKPTLWQAERKAAPIIEPRRVSLWAAMFGRPS